MPFDVAQFARPPGPFPPVQFPQFAVVIGFGSLLVLFITKASSAFFLGSSGGFVALGHDAPQQPLRDRWSLLPSAVHPVRETVKAASYGLDGWQSGNVTVTIWV
jgi:hypothetical protein